MTAKAGVSPQAMRAFLASLDDAGELTTITEPVDLEFEVAACLAEADGGPALKFNAVREHRMPVVGNLLTALPRIAAGLSTTPERMQSAILSAIDRPLEHRIISSAPCQEEVIVDPILKNELPIPRFFQHERGSYITAGAIVAKDRLTGRANLSIARVMPLDANRAFVGIAPNHHLAVLARAAQARGETLDIAVTIGNHPVVLIAACLYLGLGDDELKVAGALFGEPLEATRCLDLDLLVPAHCECVLEGKLNAGEQVEEGSVSEFHGMYENYGAGVVATFSRLTRRRDAIFQVILPGYHREHCLIGGVAIAADGTVYFASRFLYALDHKGEAKWIFRPETSYTENEGFGETPVIAEDGTVYAFSRHHELFAITASGRKKWVVGDLPPGGSGVELSANGILRTPSAWFSVSSGLASHGWPSANRDGRNSRSQESR